MSTIKIKGHEIAVLPVRDSFNRRAQQFKNKIIETLRKLGLTEDDIDIDLETSAVKNVPASAAWYMDGHYMHYSYKASKKYVDNLQMVFKVIELEVNALLSGQKTPEEFVHEFSEDKDVEEIRKKARETLGVEHDVLDLAHIDIKYKELAKKYHPDMPDGNVEKFKEINHAHKILRRELQ